MEKIEQIKEILNNLNTWEIVDIHNQYCEKNNYMDDYIYMMDELDDLTCGRSAIDIINDFGDIDTTNEYFQIGIYGASSFNYYDDCSYAYYDEIASYCIANDDDFDNSDIREILESEGE